MRRLAFAVLLAGCTTAVPFDDPCACVIVPDINGAVSVTLGGEPVLFDPEAQEDPQIAGISGTLYWMGDNSSASGLDLYGGGLGLAATWGTTLPVDLTLSAPLTDLNFDTSAIASVAWEDSQYYELGPQGGSLRLREIAPEADGWRLRGDYSGQVCLEDGSGCTTMRGSFALSVPELPPGAEDSGLIVPAS